jgi:cyanophycinase
LPYTGKIMKARLLPAVVVSLLLAVQVVGRTSRLPAGRLALDPAFAGETPAEAGGTPTLLQEHLPLPLTDAGTRVMRAQETDSGGATNGSTRYGPAKGTLVIAGGGAPKGTGIMETFVNLAGGADAKIVIVPTANGNRGPDGQPIVYQEEDVVGPWKRLHKLKHVRMLHTFDPEVANTEEFVQPLRQADAVWFDGGRQWNLVDSYAGTLAEKEFHKVLERGGVIGGTSAGATIQGDYLVRGAVAGPEIVMAPEPEHQHGFGFLRHCAIDQHINTRNRWDDLIPVLKKYPDLLGIGLSESTAIIVTGDRFEVMGKWKVAVHDNTRLYQPWEKPYFVLEAGDVYNMRTRAVEKYGDEPPPASLIKRGP